MGSFLKLFATTNQCHPINFLGLKPWYAYLNLNSQCGFDSAHPFNLLPSSGSPSDLLLIFLAIIDDMLIIAGLVAVAFVIYAGFKYITSQGSPNETAQAQSTIIYALVGLAIAIIAIPTVSYLGDHLGNTTTNPGNIPIASNTATLNLSSLPNPSSAASGGIVTTILQIVFGIAGALALIFVVIGGLRYVFSSGDPQAAASARGTIIYALVGLLVAIVAESIVSLVIGKIG